jgi:hypothetical protein
MLGNKLFRRSLSFGTITIASALLYPAAENGEASLVYFLLGLILLAALIALKRE